jgi:hypothetical protein
LAPVIGKAARAAFLTALPIFQGRRNGEFAGGVTAATREAPDVPLRDRYQRIAIHPRVATLNIFPNMVFLGLREWNRGTSRPCRR